ncbi:MAG: hypothetical protein JXR42_04500 [Gammaproteobacteria bacterium]|nr:hypothetical protein [Gammaproteobacteria bacterium]
MIKDFKISDLKLSAKTRVQCMHGCLFYKKNQLCPPHCLDLEQFKELINSYEYIRVVYENINYNDKEDLLKQRRHFHDKLLQEERKLKQNNVFSIAFDSGVDAMHDVVNNSDHGLGRFPICATGIDLQHLCAELLGISTENMLSFWKLLLPEFLTQSKSSCLCLGCVLF